MKDIIDTQYARILNFPFSIVEKIFLKQISSLIYSHLKMWYVDVQMYTKKMLYIVEHIISHANEIFFYARTKIVYGIFKCIC